ncbi:uncharacterized protein LOC111643504 [Copidosoma floridanum]|uniref:uncharacterized protein LOC111643503 n=1 Tax=Copidosoma floridanum TaxID=29053 RepID=UPI000C6F51CC|nr:uncharacterized protein LOC111643503 [Copidosoma floridanum]XP_023247238.1 uncharacterized protein LOC111643504 [Copidosoma floridanum]
MIASNTLGQPKFLKVYDICTTVDLDRKIDFVKELDCTQFTSSEITVKVIGRDIIVKAEQKEQQNGANGPSSLNTGFYNVSDLYDLEKVEALLGLDKVLTLYAPRKDNKVVDVESPRNIEENANSLINVKNETQKENQ